MKVSALVAAAILTIASTHAAPCTVERAAAAVQNALNETQQRGDCAGPAMETVGGVWTACALQDEDVDLNQFNDDMDELRRRCENVGKTAGSAGSSDAAAPTVGVSNSTSYPKCTEAQSAQILSQVEENIRYETCSAPRNVDDVTAARKLCGKACLDAWAATINKPRCAGYDDDYWKPREETLALVKSDCAKMFPQGVEANTTASPSASATSAPTASPASSGILSATTAIVLAAATLTATVLQL